MMTADLQRSLEVAFRTGQPLEEIVAMLRHFKAQGVTQGEAYALLEEMRRTAATEAAEDRILEVADFVAGFCSPHMNIWDTPAG
ncbi:MAG: hypothetical protein K2R98_23715 [Gemmataceae bacterium]|nr:hypothetical protein [Gemmataceae bacterium]